MITYFPSFPLHKSYAIDFLNVYRRLAMHDFDIVHFNLTPGWSQGGYSLFLLARISHTPTILNIHGIVQLEYELYGRKKK